MRVKTSKTATKSAAANSAKKEPRYYTEGVVKDLWLESETDTRFTLTPDSGYSIEAEYNGERTTCSVFRSEDFAEGIFGKSVADLYAGDFIFSASKGMTFDQLLAIKINGFHIRIYVANKDSVTKYGGEAKDPLQVSEIRLK